MTISLEWGEQQCRIMADLLLKAGHSQNGLISMVPPNSLAEHLREDYAARAGLLSGMAADLVGCMADLRQERGEDDLEQENRDQTAGEAEPDSQDPAGVDA
jgi:hypothetical protein